MRLMRAKPVKLETSVRFGRWFCHAHNWESQKRIRAMFSVTIHYSCDDSVWSNLQIGPNANLSDVRPTSLCLLIASQRIKILFIPDRMSCWWGRGRNVASLRGPPDGDCKCVPPGMLLLLRGANLYCAAHCPDWEFQHCTILTPRVRFG